MKTNSRDSQRLGPGLGPFSRYGVIAVGLFSATCKQDSPIDMAPAGPVLVIQHVNSGAQVAEQLRAAIEMQHAGEPLAQTMGRDLAGYDRNSLVTDQYKDPKTGVIGTDVVGYSTAVESYEYSKLAMNSVSLESGAGLSLMYGPVVNPLNQTGASALALLRTRVQALAVASRAGVDNNGPWVIVPAPTANPLNVLGFPGLWPEMAEFASYDQAIAPSGNAVRNCTLSSGYGGSAGQIIQVGDYECGYNTLHINRDAATKSLAIDALGLAAWKQALWVINYFQFVHDPSGLVLTQIAAADRPLVGKAGNIVIATDDAIPPKSGAPGAYIGSSDLEGFQGLVMAEEIDNKAALLLGQLTSADGQTLGGFATLKAALDYDYQSPLRYFPHSVKVTEQPGTGGAEAQPVSYALETAPSHLPDYSALLGGYAEMFALTDRNNSGVGGSPTVLPVFDGDPFALDNGLPDGEATPHDRALAVLKVALINLDRLHGDPQTGVLVDTAQVSGPTVTRGSHVTTVELTYALIGLRTAYRSLTSQLTLYSNSAPDTTATTTALDATLLRGVPGGVTLAQRIQQLIKIQADFLNSKLVAADGGAVNGYDLAASKADTDPTLLESQAAAVRGLLEAYLATSDTSYRSRAQAAYQILEQNFYNQQLRIYRPQLNEDTTFTFTPGRYGALQGALREMYNLVAVRPGQETLRTALETRLGRLRKLVLNGWDDRNNDNHVDYPAECMQVRATLPRGGLQLAERALTGELGLVGAAAHAPTSDRDHDCVPEIDDAQLPATLGASIVIVRQ